MEARQPILKHVEMLWERVEARDAYPFTVPVVRNLTKLVFHPRVTFIVGENGCGKSTLVEALALACGFNGEGGGRNFRFSTGASHSSLFSALRLARLREIGDGYFYRAESFLNLATTIDALDREPAPAPRIIDSYGGISLDHQSHAEAVLSLVKNRFRPGGLYIMDEPESGLSPLAQLGFLNLVDDLASQGAQFIIATHSPMLMAYPEATLYAFQHGELASTSVEAVEHFTLTRDFLNRPEAFLKAIRAGK